MDTPAFLVWAIECSCPVRGFQNGSDPERTERQLRAARAVSDARREGLVFEGFCVNPPNGFRVDDALAVYGGVAAVECACAGCAANALAHASHESLAGCFGITPLSPNVEAGIEEALSRGELRPRYERLFSPTKPRAYGLWIRMPLEHEQCSMLHELFADLDVAEEDHVTFAEMKLGLRAAVDADLRMHVTLFPAGQVEGTAWKLVPHCPRCKGPWDKATVRGCRVCGYEGLPAPDRKRKARGQRPYFPLDRLLSDEAAAKFLLRYDQFRAQRELSRAARSRPRAERPNNRPDD